LKSSCCSYNDDVGEIDSGNVVVDGDDIREDGGNVGGNVMM